MDEAVQKDKQRFIDVVRGDFTILLFFSVYGLLFIYWIIIWIEDANSTYPIYENVVGSFLAASFIIFFISLIVVMLSRIPRLRWWNAIPVTFFLLGTPLLAWILSLIAAQIARLFYVPTVKDLTEIRDGLKMKIKPIKKYLPVYEEYLAGRVIANPYYFSQWQITIAAVLGGFMGGGLMLAANYKQLGEKKRFAVGLVLSILSQFVVTLLIYSLVKWNEEINFLHIIPFLLFIPTLCHLIYSEFLMERINPLVGMEKIDRVSWWSLFGVTVVSLLFLVGSLIFVDELSIHMKDIISLIS